MNAAVECWHSLRDLAERLGVSERSIRRTVEAVPELRQAARQVAGNWMVPASAFNAWLEHCPRWGTIDTAERVARLRRPAARQLGQPVVARSEGEIRRKLGQLAHDHGQAAGLVEPPEQDHAHQA